MIQIAKTLKRKLFTTSLLMMISGYSLAQSSNAFSNSVINNKTEKYNAVTVNAFSFFSPLPRIRAGYFTKINNKWGISLDAGFMKLTSHVNERANRRYRYKLWEVRPELQYVMKRTSNKIIYTSVELFYINLRENLVNDYFESSRGIVYFQSANYQRHKLGSNINIGARISLSQRFGIVLYQGLGFKWKRNQYWRVEKWKWGKPRDFSAPFINISDDYRLKEGEAFTMNFTLGMKLFYRL